LSFDFAYSPDAEPEARIQGQRVYLEGDVGKHQEGNEEMRQGF
jgi:hypothetical protein